MKKRRVIHNMACIGIALFLAGCGARGNSEAEQSSAMPYRQEITAERLNVPWAIDFSPDGRIFFTERPGTIRVIEKGTLISEPVLSFPPPFLQEGEGGLLGLALDPDFLTNHYMYVYHSYREKQATKNRVLRLIEEGNKARVDKVLLDNIPGSLNHNGGRIKIGPDHCLYITTGDVYERQPAQDQSSLAGKILRINLDGTLPKDNPFPSSPVYSFGHRNPQGLAWHPVTGALFSAEHGQSAHDEVNVIRAGANYGWPVIEGDKTAKGMEKPLLHSGDETWAPSGIAFITKGPWEGQLLIASLRGKQLLKVELETAKFEKAKKVQPLFPGQFGRIRDVAEAPDGTVYFLTNNRDGRGEPQAKDDRIIRLVPAAQ